MESATTSRTSLTHARVITRPCVDLFTGRFLNFLALVRAVAEGPVLRLLAIAQPKGAGFFHLKPYGSLGDFVLHELVGTIAQWLRLGTSAETPRITFAFLQLHPEWFLIIHHTVGLLLLGRV